MILYYDRAGKPMTGDEWRAVSIAAQQSAEAYRRIHIVAKTEVGDLEVSTIWLGIDHAFGRGRPLIFETMIMGHGAQWRHHTEEQAKAVHDRIVARLGAGADPFDFEDEDFDE